MLPDISNLKSKKIWHYSQNSQMVHVRNERGGTLGQFQYQQFNFLALQWFPPFCNSTISKDPLRIAENVYIYKKNYYYLSAKNDDCLSHSMSPVM